MMFVAYGELYFSGEVVYVFKSPDGTRLIEIEEDRDSSAIILYTPILQDPDFVKIARFVGVGDYHTYLICRIFRGIDHTTLGGFAYPSVQVKQIIKEAFSVMRKLNQ